MECLDPHTPKMFLSLKAGLLLMLNSQIRKQKSSQIINYCFHAHGQKPEFEEC